MADHSTTRDQLIEQAARVVSQQIHSDHREPGPHSTGIARALADAGLLGDASAVDVLEKVRAKLGVPDGRAISVYAAEVRKERDALQARLDEALEWWRQERDADSHWPLSLEDSAKVNSLRYRLYAALTGHQFAEQPMPTEASRVALQGDQPAEPKREADPTYYGYAGWGRPLDENPEFAEPPVTPSDPSGHITDGGPVRPFQPADLMANEAIELTEALRAQPDPGCDACGRPRTDPRHAPGAPIGHPYRARSGCNIDDCPDGPCPCEPNASEPPDA